MRVDRRSGAVTVVAADRMETIKELRRDLRVIQTKGIGKNISREEVHALIDEIYEDYGGQD